MAIPNDIIDEVRQVLLRARTAPAGSTDHVYLTAYQILANLSDNARNRLVTQYVRPGKGAGRYYSAASAVSDAAETLEGIDIRYLNTRGLQFLYEGKYIEAGNATVGAYRL
jgi:hypothetical protein